MKIEVSNGEIVDKLTILQIKLERIQDQAKLQNVKKEYDELEGIVDKILGRDDPLYQALYEINGKLWDIEDRIRELEKARDFGQEFIDVARAVYVNNDQRAAIKRDINQKTGSELFEEKSYEDY
jgi:predicted nuclease with TOPRIM domain